MNLSGPNFASSERRSFSAAMSHFDTAYKKISGERRGVTLGEAIEKYTENAPKGEFVLIVAGAEAEPEEQPTEEDASAYLSRLLASGMSKKDAVKQTAKDLGLPKNVVYDIALKETE